MTKQSEYFDMNAAPMRIGRVRLKARDLDRVATFYQTVLGLDPIGSGDSLVTLGRDDTPLLEIAGDPTLSAVDGRQAGLFHTAFLLPTRAELGRWLAHANRSGIALQGASDHIVSEALYLADPEGNGIEVYADRPVRYWHGHDGHIRMATDPLDLQDLLRSAGDRVWEGFPLGGSIGHVHLQVGDIAQAERFYRDVLGFEIAASYPGASFFGSGGYHHQLAGNVWNSRHAGQRREDAAGLDAVDILVRDEAHRQAIVTRAGSAEIVPSRGADAITLHDPWGTRINLVD